jgi:hypothetical protein
MQPFIFFKHYKKRLVKRGETFLVVHVVEDKNAVRAFYPAYQGRLN